METGEQNQLEYEIDERERIGNLYQDGDITLAEALRRYKEVAKQRIY